MKVMSQYSEFPFGAALSSLLLPHIPFYLSPVLVCCSWTGSVFPLALWVTSVASRKVCQSVVSQREENQCASLWGGLLFPQNHFIYLFTYFYSEISY